MGEDNFELGRGILHINDQEFFWGFPSIECHEERNEANEYVKKNTFLMSVDTPSSITIKMKVNRIALYKISGLWDWVLTYCPDQRVRHLMQYGKTKEI